MNEIPAWTLRFTKEELYLIAGMLQTGNLLGFEDPFLGQLADTVEIDLAAAQASLMDRGYLNHQADEEVDLDSTITTLVKAVTTSDKILVAVSTFGEDTSFWFYHFTPGLLVEQLELPNGEIILTAIKNTQALSDRLRMLFALKETFSTNDFPSFLINMNELSNLRERGRADLDLGLESLEDAGVPAEVAPSILSAIQEGRYIDSLIVLERGEYSMEYGKKLNWLYGSGGVWLVSSAEKDDQMLYELSPTTNSNINQMIWEIANSLFIKSKL